MSTDDNKDTSATDTKPSGPLTITSDEVKVFATLGGIIGLWVLLTLLFGFGGLIAGALIMVAVMFVVLVTISRG